VTVVMARGVLADSGEVDAPQPRCSAIQAKIAREGMSTLPSVSFSAGSFVEPVAFSSSSREPLRKNGIGLPCAATTFS
jgi:hypothetical protein